MAIMGSVGGVTHVGMGADPVKRGDRKEGVPAVWFGGNFPLVETILRTLTGLKRLCWEDGWGQMDGEGWGSNHLADDVFHLNFFYSGMASFVMGWQSA